MSDASETGVKLELDQLSAEALRGLVEEFVTREGTDYGDGRGDERRDQEGPGQDWTLEEKVAQIIEQLERGEARIVFDLELASASIVATSSPCPVNSDDTDRGPTESET